MAVPVPFLLMWAPNWSWVLFANALLGVSQGLTWSTTVIMKIDLAGAKNRGLAMGLNEFAGYFAVAGSAVATGWIAERWGLRPEPFYLGVAYVLLGVGLSVAFVRETRLHVATEAAIREFEARRAELEKIQADKLAAARAEGERLNGKVVTIATIALAAAYLVNFVVSLFGVRTGMIGWGPGAGMLAMLVSAVAVVLAVLNLIMDFDYIEQGVRNGAPASESWRAAFGLTVTMVWLYTELLRILSYFRLQFERTWPV